MTTLERPPRPAPAPAPDPLPASARFITVFADLMPDEVRAGRRGRAMKRRVLIGLVAVVLLLAAGYAFSWVQTHNAGSDLSSAQARAAALTRRQADFTPLVKAQADSAQIQQTLAKLMSGDLQWSKLLESIRGTAGRGVDITSVNGSVTTPGSTGANTGPAAAAGGISVLNQTGEVQIGSLTITGTASDKNAVAAFVDRLSRVRGLAAAFPASVATTTGKLTFSVNVILTSKALGGRYAVKPATPGGK
jgi:Tfp pilus assembly protein PilN